MQKRVWEAIATLIGATVGAGILGVPYIIAKSGLLFGIIDILVIGFMILMLNLYFAESNLRTKKNHQITGLAEEYFGKKAGYLAAVLMTVASFGALIAYLIASGELIYAIVGGGSTLAWSFLFFVSASMIVYIGIKAVKKGEYWILIGLLVVLFLIVFIAATKLNVDNLTTINLPYALAPYGIILFALFGYMAIPEMREVLDRDKTQIKRAIILGTLLSIFITIIFAVAIVGSVSLQNFEALPPDKRIATVALGTIFNQAIAAFANLFALFSISTSFIAIGYAMKEMFHFDYKVTWGRSWLYAMVVPIAVYLLNVIFDITDFLKTLSFTGAILNGLIGILVVLIYRKAKKKGKRKPEFSLPNMPLLDYLIICLFIFGIIYEIVRIF